MGFEISHEDSPHVSDSSQIVPFVRRGMFLVKCTHVDMAAVASTWYCTRPLMFVGFSTLLNPSFTPSPLRASYSRGTRRAKRGSVSWETKSQKHLDGFCTWLVEVGAKTQSPRQPDDQSTRLAKVAASTTGPCRRLALLVGCAQLASPRVAFGLRGRSRREHASWNAAARGWQRQKVHRLVKGVVVWAGWRDLAGLDWCLGTVLVAPVLPKKGSKCFRTLVASAQGGQKSVLAKGIFSTSKKGYSTYWFLCTRLAEAGANKGDFLHPVTACSSCLWRARAPSQGTVNRQPLWGSQP